MARHPFIKLGLAAGGAYAVYAYLLNDTAKEAVRTGAVTVTEKLTALLKELKIIRDDFKGTSVKSAQEWAASQWEAAGFGDL